MNPLIEVDISKNEETGRILADAFGLGSFVSKVLDAVLFKACFHHSKLPFLVAAPWRGTCLYL